MKKIPFTIILLFLCYSSFGQIRSINLDYDVNHVGKATSLNLEFGKINGSRISYFSGLRIRPRYTGLEGDNSTIFYQKHYPSSFLEQFGFNVGASYHFFPVLQKFQLNFFFRANYHLGKLNARNRNGSAVDPSNLMGPFHWFVFNGGMEIDYLIYKQVSLNLKLALGMAIIQRRSNKDSWRDFGNMFGVGFKFHRKPFQIPFTPPF